MRGAASPDAALSGPGISLEDAAGQRVTRAAKMAPLYIPANPRKNGPALGMGVGMGMSKSETCEAWISGRWQLVGVEDAKSLPKGTKKRCVECGGPVRAHRTGKGGAPGAHFEHQPGQGHAGCSLGHYFDGQRRPHPSPVT